MNEETIFAAVIALPPEEQVACLDQACGSDAELRRRVEVEGFPVCHIDDIIASKAATNPQKDRESLPRLRSFRECWVRQRTS